MRSAFNITELKNHFLLDDVITLHKSKVIDDQQFDQINDTYQTNIYCPHFLIKILLFIGSTIALQGVTALIALLFLNALEEVMEVLSIVYGLALFVFANVVLIKEKKHFRSGALECVLYHALTFILVGIYALADFNEHLIFVSLILSCLFLTLYYLDWLSTLALPFLIGAYTFYILQLIGGIMEQLTPFILCILFGLMYLLSNKWSKSGKFDLYASQFDISKTIALLLSYLSVNYFTVREMSIELMNLHLEDGENIPFAWIFYILTMLTPLIYLYIGIKRKDKIFIRVGLIVIALTVFTFKYYFSLGHTELMLTIAGVLLTGISVYLLRALKTPQQGFTRELLLTDKWADKNAEAIVIAQTLGGTNQEDHFNGQGGEFGGGGASGNF